MRFQILNLSFCTLNNFLSVKQMMCDFLRILCFCTLNNFLSVKLYSPSK